MNRKIAVHCHMWHMFLFCVALHSIHALPHTPPRPASQASHKGLPELPPPQRGKPAGKYEITSVAGEPNYKSVNLTWEVVFVPATPHDGGDDIAERGEAVTNRSAEVEPPRAFQVYFCELQAFGPHGCRSKLVDASDDDKSTSNDDEQEEVEEQEVAMVEGTDVQSSLASGRRRVRHYTVQIDRLRMATKYSFHIRAQNTRRSMKKIADHAAEIFGADNEVDFNALAAGENGFDGQSIIIPTKGFSAEATKCLPHASEIEVETGPYFGGKIVVDGGNCGVKGNPLDATDKYTMRIDHKACGSLVKPETNTVETFITVQENLGIYTHSTRRFVVVCSFQSGMQTVRASFTVPGKGGVAAPIEENDPFIPDERMGREQRLMRFVDRSELILKDTTTTTTDDQEFPGTEASQESQALVREVMAPKIKLDGDGDTDAPNSVATLSDIVPGVNERLIKHDDDDNDDDDDAATNEIHQDDIEKHLRTTERDDIQMAAVEIPSINYAKLTVDHHHQAEHESDHEWSSNWHISGGNRKSLNAEDTTSSSSSLLHFVTAHLGGLLLTVAVSVIIVGLFVGLLWRELRGARFQRTKRGCRRMTATPFPSSSLSLSPPLPPLPPKHRRDGGAL